MINEEEPTIKMSAVDDDNKAQDDEKGTVQAAESDPEF